MKPVSTASLAHGEAIWSPQADTSHPPRKDGMGSSLPGRVGASGPRAPPKEVAARLEPPRTQNRREGLWPRLALPQWAPYHPFCLVIVRQASPAGCAALRQEKKSLRLPMAVEAWPLEGVRSALGETNHTERATRPCILWVRMHIFRSENKSLNGTSDSYERLPPQQNLIKFRPELN